MKGVRTVAVINLLVLVFAVNTVTAKPTQQHPCPGAPASFLSEQAQGRVTFTPFGKTPVPVRVHSEAGLNSRVIAELADGTPFTVISMPACADGMVWWQIKTDDGVMGWVAEGNSSGYFLELADNSLKTAPTPTLQPGTNNLPATYHMPLAYIGADNNVYVTDLSSGKGTRITGDGTLPVLDCGDSGASQDGTVQNTPYTTIKWSPAGGRFIVARTGDSYILDSLYLVESGQKPHKMTSILPGQNEKFGSSFAWSPDGSHITYPGLASADDKQVSLMVASLTGTAQPLTTIDFEPVWGSGPCTDTEAGWADQDSGFYYGQIPKFSLAWVPAGILFPSRSTDDSNQPSIQLVDATGNTQWKVPGSLYFLAAPNGQYAMACPYVVDVKCAQVDIQAGTLSATTAPAIDAWAYDSETFFYHTGHDLWSIAGQNGQPTRIASFPEGMIGAISPSPDNKGVAISLFTAEPDKAFTSLPATPNAAAYVYMEVLYVQLHPLKTTFVAFGRQPSFGPGTFVALPASS